MRFGLRGRRGWVLLLTASIGGGGLFASGLTPERAVEAGLPPVLSFGAGPASLAASLDGEAFDVVVWNAHKGRDEGFARAFATLVRHADLVLLQEAWAAAPGGGGSAMQRAMLRARGLGWRLAVSWVDPGPPLRCTGVATGARARPVGCERLLSPATEPLVGTPKAALLTRYRLRCDGDRSSTLLVANVHLLNFVSTATFARQLEQIGSAIARHRGPVLLAGDFNTWSEAKRDRLARLAQRLGLAPVRFDGHGADSDARTRVFGHPLDHAFVRGLRVLAAHVETTGASDHHALRLELACERARSHEEARRPQAASPTAGVR
ncbi:MAG: endonuclease/exonuclease/phosphatase family protein [Planctomycetota bacterium]|nr:MAG: endonuclease/exonuclease/phosphatase family protein [Planctomycetota bacterium]